MYSLIVDNIQNVKCQMWIYIVHSRKKNLNCAEQTSTAQIKTSSEWNSRGSEREVEQTCNWFTGFSPDSPKP